MKRGHKVILSAPWYLDIYHYGEQYQQYYNVDLPQNLFGGKACQWGEFVDATNVEPRTWPRASAVIERLWSNPNNKVDDTVRARLNNFRCFMVKQGYNAEPIFPSHC